MSAVPVLPALGGHGSPCPSPARTVRVGAVPRPRLRPLHEVLAATPPQATARPDVVTPETTQPTQTTQTTQTTQATQALDALADAARPAAVSLFGVLAEILDGRRPVTQLRPLCVDGLYADAVTALDADHPSTRPSRSRVSGVRVCAVGPTAAEVSAVLHRDGRARAIAARLERAGRRWWLAALVVG